MDTTKLAEYLLNEWGSKPTALTTRADVYDIIKADYDGFSGLDFDYSAKVSTLYFGNKDDDKRIVVEIEDGKFYIYFEVDGEKTLQGEYDYTDKTDIIKALNGKMLRTKYKIFGA